MIYLFNIETQDIFNSQMIWFMIIISILLSTLLVFMVHIIIKYVNLKKLVYSQQKLLYELTTLQITKNKNRIKNGKI
tara:strand:+ start:2839 stop:3069 length:231 start_codon:yes stop_codon:yes gene_type:complete